jgi:bifunctional non-homologous end joining protein LigD
VRLITRGGYDWTKRYPWIVEAARRNRQKQFVIDGEAVILGINGISDFNALHAGRSNGRYNFARSMFWRRTVRMFGLYRFQCARPSWNAFCVAGRTASLSTHSRLAVSVPISSRQPATWVWRAWFQNDPTDPYRGGRSPHWIKMKNCSHHAMVRVKERLKGSTMSTQANRRRPVAFSRPLDFPLTFCHDFPSLRSSPWHS